ncbi:F-box/kelch-repeat protein At2g44130-like [Impatiens glandulifera]|uniref:F-box/kelch-repeat protein At2g44130-like n=1 Tax=Impatiens glandulifera TaxID=253017 RepID=UPI001FB13BEE|nr:F-box/kelch-repeat protein At2g44130-like [Impatiens glandulifera]
MNLSNLPDELVLHCFARLPNKSRYTASFVCTKWLELLQSREFYLLRKQLGHINRLTCFVEPNPPNPPTGFSRMSLSETPSSNPPPSPTPSSHVISVFGTGSGSGLCKTLPPLPNPSIQIDDDCKIVSSEEKLILMKNSDPLNLHLGNPLFVFDFATGRWHQGKSLPARKSAFAMDATVDGCRVFVAGGYHPEGGDSDSSWMYDVRKDEWSELTRFQHVHGSSTGKVFGVQLQTMAARVWKRRLISVTGIFSIITFKYYETCYSSSWSQSSEENNNPIYEETRGVMKIFLKNGTRDVMTY